MNCCWKYATAPEDLIRCLARELGCSLPLAEALWKRGHCEPPAAAAFLAPKLANLSDPFLIPGMREAAERLLAALETGRRIVLYCDYDVDGLTSAALLWRCLAAYGGKPAAFLPERLSEGYGLTARALERCLSRHRPELLVVLDCGTNSRAEIARVRSLGIEAIVVDHHEPENPASPDVLINPKLRHSTFGIQHSVLCTAGLAFKLCHAFLKLAGTGRFELKDHLDLVALGTVADLVPLTGENRILAAHGLKQMAATRHAGLKALMDVSDVAGCVTTFDCGFKLGPRLNAAGRLESAEAALELLVTGDEVRAAEIAARLDLVNRERRALQERIYEEAVVMAQEQFLGDGRVLVVAKDGWHPGVVGIVAAKLAQRFHRPAFVIALDSAKGVGKGSGRSIVGVPLVDALQQARQCVTAGGGHTMAVGVTLAAGSVEEFRLRLDGWARELPDESLWTRSLSVDLELPLAALGLELAEELERMGPFGSGNPPVLIAVRGARVQRLQRVGSDGKHLSLVLESGASRLRSIFFQFENRRAPAVGQPVNAVFELKRDQYQGFVNVQGLLKDLVVDSIS